MGDKSKRGKLRFWKRKSRSVPTKAKLERHLELAYPGPGREQDKLKLVILDVLLKGGLEQDEVVELARRRNLSAAKAKEFLHGDVEFGFRWDVLESLLVDCGADPASVEVAGQLFAEFPRREHPRHRSAQDQGQPPKPGTPAPRSDDESAQGLGDTAAHVPRPRNGNDSRRRRADPCSAATPEQYIAAMFYFRVCKGNPSYRKMSAAVGNRYAHTTFSSLKNRPTLPSLDLAMSFLTACGAHRDELSEWEAAWQRIALAQVEHGEESPGGHDL
ncbi:hypothetical protein SMC26_10510 [Actinomadura fulvescens]|uniref:Uncharacterized protein n=1 Tax=Actinomadura fulvescens TaxID=46160 RepID=A0ABN3Q4D5_9ACTN